MRVGATEAGNGGGNVAFAMRGSLASGLSLNTSAPENAGMEAFFSGKGPDFAGILVRGVFMQLLTFGFYRFWLITQVRRHLWSNTRIGRESLEYTGTARELLVGFLIALAILVPVYILYFLVGLIAETMQAFASIPLILVLYCLGYYAAYRARRYRATRTLFRGIRFWMTGSGWGYLARAALWDLATLLTLGLAYPWRKAALERYLMRHTLYGTLKGDFVGTGWELFKKLAPIWGMGILGGGAIVILFSIASSASAVSVWQAILVVSVIVLPIVFPMSLAVVMRWRLNGIRIGEAALVSTLPILTVLGCSLLFMLAVFAFSAAVGIIAAMVVAVAGVSGAALLNMEDLGVASIVATGLFYVWALLSIGAIKRYFIERGLWRASVRTVSVTNLGSIEAAAAAGKPASGVGEGLADALDMGI